MSRISDRNQLMDNSYDLVMLNAAITENHAVNQKLKSLSSRFPGCPHHSGKPDRCLNEQLLVRCGGFHFSKFASFNVTDAANNTAISDNIRRCRSGLMGVRYAKRI